MANMANMVTKVAAMTALAMAAPVLAGKPDGRLQVKLLGTGVLPNGEITRVNTDLVGLPVGAQTKVTDSFIPTLAIEYFLTPRISLETICCVTPHEVRGAGALGGAQLIDNAIILPASLTGKYHFLVSSAIKPYIGAGVTHFFIFGEDPGRDAVALGVTSVNLSNRFGALLQAGVDIPINNKGLALSLDAKRYFVGTTASFRAGDTVAISTRHKLDPWVLSGGLAYRF